MASFNYVAIEASGKQKKGTIEAANEAAAKNALKAEGLIPVSIEVPNALNKEISINIGKKVKAKDLSIFCKQFESILHAGVTVIQALHMMTDQVENKHLKKALDNTRILVEKGETLADAMRAQEDIFPPILLNMVEAGEASGSLEVSFRRMAEQFEKDNKTAGMIKQAMIYPCVLLVVVIGVVALMLMYVIPQFKDTLEGAGASLPAITVLVMNISNGLIHWWPIVLGVVIALIISIRIFIKTETGAVVVGRLILKIPLAGDLSVKSAAARLARTLSTLMASGIPMVTAIEIVTKIMSNRIIQKVLEEAKKDVERGTPLSQPLEASGVFPPLLYNMAAIGEETGNMEEMLEHAADFYENEVEAATKAVTSVMEPLIIVLMAGIVVPIMLAIMAPMMSIYGAAENS
ncbi:MAG: type II secretion system F family protein [Lachnospiraceae bacterium]|nr:type II secretion system F family protein [Lachnospiraceae bacterium]